MLFTRTRLPYLSLASRRLTVPNASMCFGGPRRFASTAAAGANMYKRLQVSEDATVDDIKAAYRRRALECHPDVVEDTKRATAEVQFRAISEAYEVLSNSSKRQEHDTRLGITTMRKKRAVAREATASHSKPMPSTAQMYRGEGSSFTQHRPRSPSSAQSFSSSSHRSKQKPWNKPFVRGDADRLFTEAFEGKSLDQILFEARRRKRLQSVVDSRGQNETASATTTSDGKPAESAGMIETMNRVLENASEQFAQRMKRQYGPGVLKHIYAVRVPTGPAGAPSARMPFRPFVGCPIPTGVQGPSEPVMGPVRHASEQEEVLLTEGTNSHHPCLLGFKFEDGTPYPRGASLAHAENNIGGASHNMGQLYSFHRPY